jgi:hypothetical protein
MLVASAGASVHRPQKGTARTSPSPPQPQDNSYRTIRSHSRPRTRVARSRTVALCPPERSNGPMGAVRPQRPRPRCHRDVGRLFLDRSKRRKIQVPTGSGRTADSRRASRNRPRTARYSRSRSSPKSSRHTTSPAAVTSTIRECSFPAPHGRQWGTVTRTFPDSSRLASPPIDSNSSLAAHAPRRRHPVVGGVDLDLERT